LTVTEIVAVCTIEPDVADTVTVDVVGVGEAGVDEPPPQAVTRMNPAHAIVSRSRDGERRRRIRPIRDNPSARALKTGSECNPAGNAADFAAALIVRTSVVAWAGVTEAGLNEQLAPAGNPEQAKVTAELKPFCGVRVNVTVPCPPTFRVSEAGVPAKVKVSGSTYAAEETVLTE
jgi:hypothetical protein